MQGVSSSINIEVCFAVLIIFVHPAHECLLQEACQIGIGLPGVKSLHAAFGVACTALHSFLLTTCLPSEAWLLAVCCGVCACCVWHHQCLCSQHVPDSL